MTFLKSKNAVPVHLGLVYVDFEMRDRGPEIFFYRLGIYVGNRFLRGNVAG